MTIKSRADIKFTLEKKVNSSTNSNWNIGYSNVEEWDYTIIYYCVEKQCAHKNRHIDQWNNTKDSDKILGT